MRERYTTLTDFLIGSQNLPGVDADLIGLLNHVQNACKSIGKAVSRGRLETLSGVTTAVNVQGEDQKPLDVLSNSILLRACEWDGQLCGMVSEEIDEPYVVPDPYPRGRYLLAFDPLDGSSNIDINMTVGTIFSVLRAPDGCDIPTVEDFLQPGTRQVAAGYAVYGPASMLVLTLGDGVHGFTLDRDVGIYVLTHQSMRVPDTTSEFAVNASNQRFWEPPVSRYVEECIQGKSGPRGTDFNMRWIASMVADLHRILLRGGLYMYPRDSKDPKKAGRLRLLYEASPAAMLMEQAGGAASTGRERILDIVPTALHQRIGLVMGSRREVDRLVDYHAAFDRGEPAQFEAPLFNTRSLFLTA